MALGDVWHKTLVYFGIAEDDDHYDEETLAPQEELEQSYRERPSVKRVERESRSGSRRRSTASGDFDDIYAQDDAFRSQRTAVIRPVPAPVEAPAVKVHLVVPKNFNDAQLIADKFKADVPVILNLQACETELSKRLIDFASGLTYALDGGMQRVADKVFLLTPKNVEVSAEERQRLMEKGFFNQF